MAGQLGQNPYASELAQIPGSSINLTTGASTGALTGILPAANGGTGFSSLEALQFNVLSQFQSRELQAVAAATGKLNPGAGQMTTFFDDMAVAATAPFNGAIAGATRGWLFNGGGAGNIQSASLVGGVVTASTGAAAGNTIINQAPGFFVPRLDTAVGYMSFYARVNTAIDVQTVAAWGLSNTLNNQPVYAGFNGGKSLTKFVGVYDASGIPGATGTTVTMGTFDNNWHFFEIWYIGDGKIHFAQDGIEWGAGPTMGAAPVVPCTIQTFLENGTTAANRSCDLDWISLSCFHL
jgi:hypothetical protein